MPEVKGLTRRERAAATRRSILRAAHEVFCARGYAGTTMALIAEQAGVAVQTVYFVFHTKPQLLAAAVDTAVRGGAEEPEGDPEQTQWWRTATTSRSARGSVEAFVDGFTEVQARVGELDLVVRAGAETDPELREVWERSEALRGAAYRRLVESFAARGFLRDGVGVDEAIDVLMTLAGPMTYLTFTRDRAWSDERYAAFTADAMARTVLTARPRPRPKPAR